MNIRTILGAGALALGLTACGSDEARETNNAARGSNAAEAAETSATHSATGTVTAVSGSTVTIDHEPVETIGWPAMTMGFEAQSAGMLEGIAAGDSVSFSFRESGGEFELTSIEKTQ